MALLYYSVITRYGVRQHFTSNNHKNAKKQARQIDSRYKKLEYWGTSFPKGIVGRAPKVIGRRR